MSNLKGVKNENDAVLEILSGNALVFAEFDGIAVMVAASAKNEDGRSIQEPDSEIVVRGPRQGFIESGEVNVALLRKIIASNELKVEVYPIGGITKTNLRVVYLEGIADKTALDILRKRIAKIPLDSMFDSGYAEQYLQNGGYPFFPEVGNSEKPDKVAAKIIEGRIAVVCDGSPCGSHCAVSFRRKSAIVGGLSENSLLRNAYENNTLYRTYDCSLSSGRIRRSA